MYTSIFIRSVQCFQHSFKILFWTFSRNFTNVLKLKRSLDTWTHLKQNLTQRGQSGPHRPMSLSVPLAAFVNDKQMLLHSMNMYTCPAGLCATVCNWPAMATRNIFMQLLQLLLAANSQDCNLTERADMGLRDLCCFCFCMKICNFRPIFTCIDYFRSCMC